MHRNPSVDVHQFAMVPRADIPRASFRMQKTLKSTFDAGPLVPVFCEEVLPGDSFNVSATFFARLSTPLLPVMDNMYLESFFFYVPNRLLWANWVKFMGEQFSPGDSISYTVPQMVCPVGGYAINSLQDYLGLPTVGQVGAGATVSHSALPTRAYAMIYDCWFRDENLVNTYAGFGKNSTFGDGPDSPAQYVLVNRGKRHDYFTSALPFVQKGTSVSIPLGTSAPVYGDGKTIGLWNNSVNAGLVSAAGGALEAHTATYNTNAGTAASGTAINSITWGLARPGSVSGLYADLTAATAATINQLRQSFQIQKLLERDARGGTRYVELLQAHFGVRPNDLRLFRPEYLGGGSTPVSINEIPQTSASAVTGSTTPLGALAAKGTVTAHGHGFTRSFDEHGYVIGLINARADLTYQQGLRRHWSRLTRYDYYFPVFAQLGEQAILNKEIYCDGSANDALVFGYQERWAEYRYNPSEITGLFRSTAASTIDPWHLAQKFTALPGLNSAFILEAPPVSRVVAIGAAANGKQFLLDAFFNIKAARPMPLYSVPGLVDHF